MIRCVLCGSNSWINYLGSLLKCEVCGYTRAQDKYFNIDPSKIYNRSYFKSSDYGDYEKERKALEKNFRDRLSGIRVYKKNGKLLEIGCAYGYFLNLAKQYFQVSGIDLDPEITQQAQKNSGVQVLTGEFLSKKFSPRSFDVICMFDTIEHLKYPAAYLKKIYTLLKPGGIIVIETGDIGSLLAKIQGKHWRLIKPPVHLQYFSKDSLCKLLGKYDFKPLTINRVSFYRTMAHSIFLFTNSQFLLKVLKPLFNFVFPINTFDLLFIVAQRRDSRGNKV